MGKKSNKKKEKRLQKQSDKSTVAVSVKPVAEKQWGRVKYGIVYVLMAIIVVVIGLMSSQDAHWPIARYADPESVNYDYAPYLIDSSTVGMRWERKILIWENPAYYLAAMLLTAGVIKISRKANKTDGIEREVS